MIDHRWLVGLTGRGRLGAAAVLGALATLALPPVSAVPVLLIAVPGLLLLLEAASLGRSAFALGWWFGFGHFTLGLYWVSFALLTDIGKFWWLMPVALAGLPAVLALWCGLVTWALWRLRPTGLARVVGFAALWTGTEWLRGHLLTGFPWQLIGYGWEGWTAVFQAASVVGVYGLSFLTLLAAGLPVLLLPGSGLQPRHARMAVAASLGLFVAIGGWGALRLAGDTGATVPDVRLRLVQPNIHQTLKWNAAAAENNFKRHLDLTTAPAAAGSPRPTVAIWSETAATYFLAYDGPHRRAIAAAAPPGGLVLTGSPRAIRDPDDSIRYWNSLVAVDGAARIVDSYDKFHLVPFGEYLPGRALLPSWLPVGAIAASKSDFSAGPGPRTLTLPGLPPVSPLICYEAIFPRAVVDDAHRPQWLLNLTNDAWYGRSAGPHQHFAIAAARAVEEGLPLVRVANTGISGVVNAYGRVTARLGLDRDGFLDADLPMALAEPTFYTRFGDSTVGLFLLASAAYLGLSRRRARTPESSPSSETNSASAQHRAS